MIEVIKYRQTHETVPCADINTVFTQMDKPAWREFTNYSISRNHAINLFSGKLIICAKEGDAYITNSEDMRRSYRKAGHRAVLFSTLSASERAIGEVGFLEG
jgi:hypothetical protein